MKALDRSLRWNAGELSQGIDTLLGAASPRSSGTSANGGALSLEAVLASTLSARGMDCVPLACRVDDISRCIVHAAPMVLSLEDSALLVVSASRHTVTLLARSGDHQSVAMKDLLALLTPALSPEVEATITRLAAEVGADLAQACRNEHLHRQRVPVGWQLPVEPEQALWNRANGLRVAGLVGLHVLHFGLWVLSWVTLVSALLSVGEREALLTVWIVALVSSLLLLPLESLVQQNLATRLGISIKQSLLRNALGMDKADVRSQGIGQLTARALEANRLDALAAQGGLRVLLSGFDAIAIIAVFLWFAGLHPLLLLFGLTLVIAVRSWSGYHKAETRLHAAHLRLTAVHTEEMIGHRTRKAFVGSSRWHAEEDACLAAYERACAEADRRELSIGAIPRLWAVLGVAVILIDLFGQGASNTASVAQIGFVIVGFGILHGASTGIMKLLKALVSARHLNPYPAERRNASATGASVDPSTGSAQGADGGAHLLVQGLEYTYPDSSRQVLRDVNLELGESGKVLMTGGSGSGKSTFGSLLAGRLEPSAGTVLSQGIDRYVAGARGWLTQVCYVPQPGINHVLTDTFAFNLLLGRAWPPSARDLQDAQAVARQLGLGPLIEKMPAGMMQMVGEGGWRLSQGEQARLFLARGILQGARLLVVDELLAPLDPVTGLEVLKAVEALPSQVVLIAHT